MTNRYVNKEGKFCDKGSWNAKPYFDWLAEDIVKTTVKEELDKEIKEKFKQVDAIIPFISLLEEMLKTFGAKDKED